MEYIINVPDDLPKERAMQIIKQFEKELWAEAEENSILTPEMKLEKWRKVTEDLPQTSANLSAEALHREVMYEDFGLSEKEAVDQPQSCYDLALELGMIGFAEDLPSDLSTNLAYFEGFGA